MTISPPRVVAGRPGPAPATPFDQGDRYQTGAGLVVCGWCSITHLSLPDFRTTRVADGGACARCGSEAPAATAARAA